MYPGFKRKATEEALREPEVSKPVIFKSSGAKPDVRLRLFGIREFHVHSNVLKLHSNYFRKFMDSAEKTPAAPSASWKYDYVSVVDEDGEWGLEVCGQNAESSGNDSNSLPLPRTPASEANAFEKFLNAMYSKPTVIEDSKELHDMTRLADFYCALPVLSTSLYVSLWNSPDFLDDIRSLSTAAYHRRPIRDTRARAATPPIVTEFPHNHPVSLLKLAAKLRHPILFREMMVYVVSLWESNCSTWEPTIKEAGLDDVVTKIYHKVHHLQASVHFSMFKGAVVDEAWRVQLYQLASEFEATMATHKQMEMAFFCNELFWELDFGSDVKLEVRELLRDLLKNNLVLNKAGTTGKGDYFFQYLCAEVTDEELPWALEETDW